MDWRYGSKVRALPLQALSSQSHQRERESKKEGEKRIEKKKSKGIPSLG
jgi:hypothetical protein